jgi:hypothetical protein
MPGPMPSPLQVALYDRMKLAEREVGAAIGTLREMVVHYTDPNPSMMSDTDLDVMFRHASTLMLAISKLLVARLGVERLSRHP